MGTLFKESTLKILEKSLQSLRNDLSPNQWEDTKNAANKIWNDDANTLEMCQAAALIILTRY